MCVCLRDIQSMDKQVKHILIMTLNANIYHLKIVAERGQSHRRDEVKVSIMKSLRNCLSATGIAKCLALLLSPSPPLSLSTFLSLSLASCAKLMKSCGCHKVAVSTCCQLRLNVKNCLDIIVVILRICR